MKIKILVNGRAYVEEVKPDLLLLDFLRQHGFYSVKQGCDTANCGLCTVWVSGTPVLSCSFLAVRADGLSVTTLEGVKQEAEELGAFLADEGAEQCGFCSPGFIMTVLAMRRELQNPTEEEIRQYLAGNLCRCTGYMSQLRAVEKYLSAKKGENTQCM